MQSMLLIFTKYCHSDQIKGDEGVWQARDMLGKYKHFQAENLTGCQDEFPGLDLISALNCGVLECGIKWSGTGHVCCEHGHNLWNL